MSVINYNVYIILLRSIKKQAEGKIIVVKTAKTRRSNERQNPKGDRLSLFTFFFFFNDNTNSSSHVLFIVFSFLVSAVSV